MNSLIFWIGVSVVIAFVIFIVIPALGAAI